MADKNNIAAYKRESKAVLQAPTVVQVVPARKGKPTTEKRSAKVLMSFTETEIEQIKKKAGLVPVATYLRSVLQENGVISPQESSVE